MMIIGVTVTFERSCKRQINVHNSSIMVDVEEATEAMVVKAWNGFPFSTSENGPKCLPQHEPASTARRTPRSAKRPSLPCLPALVSGFSSDV